MTDVVVFLVGAQRYLLPLAKVIEIAPMVNITPIPGVGSPIVGYVRYRGTPTAVVDFGVRVGATREHELGLNHHLIVTALSDRRVALLVDHVLDLDRVDSTPEPLERSASPVAGIVPDADGSLFVVDLEQVLSLEERRSVAAAMAALSTAASVPS